MRPFPRTWLALLAAFLAVLLVVLLFLPGFRALAVDSTQPATWSAVLREGLEVCGNWSRQTWESIWSSPAR